MLSIKRFFLIFLTVVLFSCSQPADDSATEATATAAEIASEQVEQGSGLLAQQWQEGVHYEVFSDQATAEREVVEYFSFWCPACYGFEPIVKMIKDDLDKDVTFKKVHVYFMGFTTPEVQNQATLAMLIGESQGQGEKYTSAIFDAIHKQRLNIRGLGDLRQIFIANGMNGDVFDTAAQSKAIAAMLEANNAAIEQNRDLLKGVPTFLINGKYKPIFNRDMIVDDMIKLVQWLSTQQ